MKRLVLFTTWLVLGVLLASPAFAWTATYSWTADPAATSYTVEKSTDNGTTWTVAGASLSSPSFAYTGTEPGLVLFRVSNCNQNGCSIRRGDGLWHNEAWAPPAFPSNVGVQ